VSRLALEDRPNFFPIGAGVLSQEQSAAEGVTLTTHPHLVPRSRMSMGYTSSPARRMYGGSRTSQQILMRAMWKKEKRWGYKSRFDSIGHNMVLKALVLCC
jgi:hypothetical protein